MGFSGPLILLRRGLSSMEEARGSCAMSEIVSAEIKGLRAIGRKAFVRGSSNCLDNFEGVRC